VAFPVKQTEIDEGPEHGKIVRPRVGLNPEDCGRGLGEHPSNNSCGEDLREQDCINLPDECVSDLKAALAHGNSILEIVWNVSKARLVVDSSGAGAGLGRTSVA